MRCGVGFKLCYVCLLFAAPGLGEAERTAVLGQTSLRKISGSLQHRLEQAGPSGMHYELSRHAKHAEKPKPAEEVPAEEEARGTTCGVMLGVLVFFCCCGGVATKFLGSLASMLSSIATIGVLVYILATGTFQRWWAGEPVNTYCMILCIWAIIQFVFLAITTCCVGLFVGAAVGASMKIDQIKNKTVKEIRTEFDELAKGLSDERKAYFSSVEFKTKCDELFDKADTNKDGVLSMEELKGSALQGVAGIAAMQQDPFFVAAFDRNSNDKIEKDEFAEMMKYFEMKYGH